MLAVALIVFTLSGCQLKTYCQRPLVSAELEARAGQSLGDDTGPVETSIPPGVDMADGVTEREAVSVALWNNAAYQDLLADLGISSAQLLDAGLISDPQFQMFFPLGPKQLEFTAFQAVDVLWLQPVRVRAASLDLDRVTETMVQNGLNVMRDVRIAHANLLLAEQQAELANEAHSLRKQIAALAQKRLEAGDISGLEATTSQIDALQAQATAARAIQDVELAQQRLRVLMGLTMLTDQFHGVANIEADVPEEDVDELVATALAMRPDLRAAEMAIQAASERSELARRQFMNLDAIYDANGQGRDGYESGPGLRFTIPIFNRNQGGRAIADAQWRKAERQYVTVRDMIVLDVQTAHTQLQQAQQNLQLLRKEILPSLKEAEELARRNYENGGATYFLVLQTTSQYLDARMRELQLVADVRRAIAELERSIGMRLSPHMADEEQMRQDTSLVPMPSVAERGDEASRLLSKILRTSEEEPSMPRDSGDQAEIEVKPRTSDDDPNRIPRYYSPATFLKHAKNKTSSDTQGTLSSQVPLRRGSDE